MDHTTDEQGRLFLDRNGEYFSHILHFMRTTLCPTWAYIAQARQNLLHECEYFGLEHMAQTLRGETGPYDLRPEDSQIKLEELAGGCLLNLFETDISALDPDTLQLPMLPSKTKRATVVGSYEDFAERFEQISGGLAREVADVEGVVFAGGSVVAALTDTGFGDIDIFLCCPRDEGAVPALLYQKRGESRGRLAACGLCAAVRMWQIATLMALDIAGAC